MKQKDIPSRRIAATYPQIFELRTPIGSISSGMPFESSRRNGPGGISLDHACRAGLQPYLLTVIDAQYLPADITCRIRQQEQAGTRDLVRLCHAIGRATARLSPLRHLFD